MTEQVAYEAPHVVGPLFRQSAERGIEPGDIALFGTSVQEDDVATPSGGTIPGFFGPGQVPSASSGTAKFSGVLEDITLDLEFIKGDTFLMPVYFDNVCWTREEPEDPIPPELDIVWQRADWHAQIRNPYLYSMWRSNYWVPTWGWQYQWWASNSWVAGMAADACFVNFAEDLGDDNVDPNLWGTRVDVSISHEVSKNIMPASWYKWDLQRTLISDDESTEDIVTTYRRGGVRVLQEWTLI